jgi:hypothetical protein
MSCKLCNIIENKHKHKIAYETDSYIVILYEAINLPVLILKKHEEFVSKDIEYSFLIEFGNFAEHHFGTKYITINRKQSAKFKHLVWVACTIDYKLDTYSGFLEQWEGR